MSSKKQSRVDLHDKQIKAIIRELENLRNLRIGTLETIKMMPDYKQALDDLTASLTKGKDTQQ